MDYLLFWPWLSIVCSALVVKDFAEYGNEVVARYLLSICLFVLAMILYDTFKQETSSQFDPSGHAYTLLITQAQHMSYWLFFSKDPDAYEKTMIPTATGILFFVFQAHACYTLFWTGFIYHRVSESLAGWAIGLLISALSYDLDFFVNFIKLLFESLGKKI